jgi:hypothetical protein
MHSAGNRKVRPVHLDLFLRGLLDGSLGIGHPIKLDMPVAE